MSTSATIWKHDLEATLNACIGDYRDLSPEDVTVLPRPPTALEALRMVHSNHPCVIKAGFSPFLDAAKAYDWSRAETYQAIEGSREVTIAVTDNGLADSVRTFSDGTTTFVKPFETKMTIAELIEKLGKLGNKNSTEAFYLQSQDGNVYRNPPRPSGPPDLSPFQDYIKAEVEWMEEAVGKAAEAVNLWVGDRKSKTSLHHDPYENIYHVLAGSKTFTLLSPLETLHLDQRFHSSSTLHPSGDLENLGLEPQLDPEPSCRVPWVSSPFIPHRCKSMTIKLEQGDTLYLPAGWWHLVEQDEHTGTGIVVALNYWYPSELHSQLYAYERLYRRIARLVGRSGVIPPAEDDLNDESDNDSKCQRRN
nr:hypothetical protein L204_06113 [Cryptococcus depauperatus CBS 7855]